MHKLTNCRQIKHSNSLFHLHPKPSLIFLLLSTQQSAYEDDKSGNKFIMSEAQNNKESIMTIVKLKSKIICIKC